MNQTSEMSVEKSVEYPNQSSESTPNVVVSESTSSTQALAPSTVKPAKKWNDLESPENLLAALKSYDPDGRIRPAHMPLGSTRLSGAAYNLIPDYTFDPSEPTLKPALDYIRRERLSVKESPTIPSYNLKNDKITIPPQKAFYGPYGFFRTLYHELIHSTGSPNRFNRRTLVKAKEARGIIQTGNMIAISSGPSIEYCLEEITAETGSAVICYRMNSMSTYSFKSIMSYMKSYANTIVQNQKPTFGLTNDPEKMILNAIKNGFIAAEKILSASTAEATSPSANSRLDWGRKKSTNGSIASLLRQMMTASLGELGRKE